MLDEGKELDTKETARIGINAHLLSPNLGYRRAGIHQYIVQVIRNLPPLRGVSYTVFTRDRASLEACQDLKIVGSDWPTERRSIRVMWEQSALPWQAARAKLNLLHSMAFVSPAMLRIPTIVTIYDLSFLHYPELFPTLQRHYLRSQSARSIAKARCVITISEASRQDVHRYFDVPLERINVVMPGVDLDYQPMSNARVDAFRTVHDLSKRFILHVGTLQPRKNIPLLLEAFAQLDQADLDLVLAGGRGWHYDEIFSMVERLGLQDRVRFLGYVADDELPLLYNAAAVLAFPSLYEGFGMPIVEAMACGTPVVAAASSSIPEAGGDAALYFDPQDASMLSEQLAKVLGDQDVAQQMRERGLIQASKFSWSKAGAETAGIYREVLDER